MLLEAAVFIATALCIAYLILLFIKVNKTPYQGSKAIYDLSQEGQLVLPSNDFTWSEAPCSLRFAIFVEGAPRTIQKVDCIQVSSTDSPSSFAPSCADYSFRPCKCSATNCGNCALDSTASGYLSNLLKIGDFVELWASGYTNQNDKPYVPALLKVRTGASNSQHNMESIPLPAIPLQKWTVITIVKEGRRFDVYYGAKLQTSQLSDYVPVPPDPTQQWVAGNSRWKGQIGFFMGFNKAESATDVLSDVEGLVNSRGIPFYMDNMDFSMPFPSFSGCIFGNCSSSLPNVKPPNPFSKYSTSFS